MISINQSIPYPDKTANELLTYIPPGGMEGFVVNNTTDNKLYTWVNGKWETYSFDIGQSPVSAGVISPHPILTDNGDGTINVSSCNVMLRSDTNHTSSLIGYAVSAINGLTIADNVLTYLVVQYNSGTPNYSLYQANQLSLIDESSVIPIFTLFRYGNHIDYVKWDSLASGLPNKLHARITKTDRFKRQSGFGLSVKNVREVLLANGVAWHGATTTSHNTVDSAVDEFTLWKKVSGVWTADNTTTQYNNSNYQGSSDLLTLPNNKYVINWIYRSETPNTKHIHYILSDNYYNTLTEAISAQQPELPVVLTSLSFLVGRIIVQQGSDTALVQSAFDQVFAPGNTVTGKSIIPIVHNPTGISVTIDFSGDLNHVINLSNTTGDVTITFTNYSIGEVYDIRIIQHGVTPRGITLAGAIIKTQNGNAINFTSITSAEDGLSMFCESGTTLRIDYGTNYLTI